MHLIGLTGLIVNDLMFTDWLLWHSSRVKASKGWLIGLRFQLMGHRASILQKTPLVPAPDWLTMYSQRSHHHFNPDPDVAQAAHVTTDQCV